MNILKIFHSKVVHLTSGMGDTQVVMVGDDRVSGDNDSSPGSGMPNETNTIGSDIHRRSTSPSSDNHATGSSASVGGTTDTNLRLEDVDTVEDVSTSLHDKSEEPTPFPDTFEFPGSLHASTTMTPTTIHSPTISTLSYSGPSRSRQSSVSSLTSTRSSSPKIYKCPEPGCESSYNRPSLLEQHRKSHSGERNFPCTHPGCGKSFFRAFHLKVHMFSHSSEKLLHCSVCDKGFNTNQHLKRHEKTHTLSHECPYVNCTSSFYRHSALSKHIHKQHEHKWEYPCPHSDCEMGFDKAIKLSKHIANDHSKIPTYGCTHNCTEKFFTWSALQAHIKSSHDKIPCSLCGKPCSGPAAVAQHMRAHNPSPQVWECRVETCMESPIFETKAELAAHYQYVHAFVPSKLRGALVEEGDENREHEHQKQDEADHQEISSKSLKEKGKENRKRKPAKKTVEHSRVAGDLSEESETSSAKRRKLTESSSVISLISGSGYEKTRKIVCTVTGCEYKFARNYDLERHLKSFHVEKNTSDEAEEREASGSSSNQVLSSFEVVETLDGEDLEIDPLLR
jgi:general transcription factor IIIA